MALTSKRPSKAQQTKTAILKEVTDVGGKPKRLNVAFEPELYQRVKMQCAKEGRGISEITRELWLEYLSK